MTELARAVRELEPQGGWWRSSTGEAVREAVAVIIALGGTSDDAVSILEPVIGAIREEYGE